MTRLSIIESLLDTARLDTELLAKNDQLGDNFTVPRLVEFAFCTDEKQVADTLYSFVMDNQYGTAHVEQDENDYRIIITIHTPVTQHVLCSLSGFMVCLAKLFKVQYDGWGCILQKA
jgi:hypothetical protein